MPSESDERDMQLLRRLLGFSARWEPPASANLTPAVHRFLCRASTATLQRLLIETARRLEKPSETEPSLDRAALHRLVQAELRAAKGVPAPGSLPTEDRPRH